MKTAIWIIVVVLVVLGLWYFMKAPAADVPVEETTVPVTESTAPVEAAPVAPETVPAPVQ